MLSGVVCGFHGCDQTLLKRIINNNPGCKEHIIPSGNKHDWLGNGIYFWDGDPARALQWANIAKRKPQHFKHKVRNPAVIGAIIDLGHCLDLTDQDCLREMKLAHDEFRKTMELSDSPMPVNEKGYEDDIDYVKRNLDCAVINYLHFLRKQQGQIPYDTVRGVFTEGGPLYKGAKIQQKTHIQICVRDVKCIKGYFLPIPDRNY